MTDAAFYSASDDLGQNVKTKALAQRIFPTPKTIGKYKITGFYAQGGMSMLYLATDPSLQEPLIIKVLQPKWLSDRVIVQEFLNEAKIISSTDHPNIVKLYEYGEWEGGLFIAMEYVRGQTLRKLLQHSPLPLKRAIDVLIQTSYAIWHLHSHGIIHGDLKPENILVTDQGQVKVIDFGISRIVSEPIPIDETVPKTFKGTPIYMSPELHTNPKQYSFQSDIYSLGIIAYELVLGKITHGKVILSLAPRGMQKILNRALKPDPEKRYKSILDMIQDLSDYTHSGEISKDRQGADYFFELFERLEEEQKALMKSLEPKDPLSPFGITASYGIGVNGLYYIHEKLDTGFFVFACETKHQGVQGLIDIYRIHTLWRYLRSNLIDTKDPGQEKLYRHLTDALVQSIEEQDIEIQEHTLLWIDRKKSIYHWESTAWGRLFVSAPNEGRSLALKVITHTLQTQDIGMGKIYQASGSFSSKEDFFMTCCVTPTLLDFPSSPSAPFEMVVSSILQETGGQEPYKRAATVLQTLRLRGDCIIDDHPALFVSINTDCRSNKQQVDHRNKSSISEI